MRMFSKWKWADFKSHFYRPVTAVILLALAVSLAGSVALAYLKQAADKHAVEVLSVVADLQAEQLERRLAEEQVRVRQIADGSYLALEVENWLQSGAPLDNIRTDILRQLSEVQDSYRYLGLAVLDIHAVPWLSTSPMTVRVDAPIRSLARQAVAQNETLLSLPFMVSILPDKQIVQDLLAPVVARDAAGSRIAGAILFRRDWASFVEFLTQRRSDGGSLEAMLVASQDREVVYLNELRHSTNAALNLRTSLAAGRAVAVMAVQGATGVVHGLDYRNAPVLAAVRQLQGAPWQLVVQKDRKEIYQSVYSKAAMLSGLALLFVLSALGVLYVWFGRQSRVFQRDHEQRYRAVIGNVHDGIVWHTYRGRIVDVNDRFCALLGYSREDLIGANLSDFESRDSFRSSGNRVERIAKAGGLAMEGEYISKDQTLRSVHINSQLLSPAHEGLIQSFVRDDTERKRAEEALKHHEDELRALIENAPAPMLVFEAAGQKTLQANLSFYRTYGYSLKELPHAAQWWALACPDESKRQEAEAVWQKLLAEAMSGKGVLKPVEVRLTGKDGVDHSVQLHGLAMGGRMLVVLIDVSMSKQAEQLWSETIKKLEDRLQQARHREELADSELAAVSERAHQLTLKMETVWQDTHGFIADLAHEIRNPMNAILGFTEILGSMIDDKICQEHLEAIKANGDRLMALVDHVYELAHLETGSLNIQYAPVNPRYVLNEIWQAFEVACKQKNLYFHLEIDPEVPAALLLDEIRFRQVLMGVVGYAVKTTDQGGIKAHVSREPLENDESRIRLAISVRDTGKGIPREQHELIFKPFNRLSRQKSSSNGGPGFNLAISQSLMQKMGGRIELESEPGQGSEFWIVYDSVDVAATLPETDSGAVMTEEIELPPAAILVADDVPYNRALLKAYLPDPSLTLIEAANGEEVLEHVRQDHPDVILMDMTMPVMDGYETVKQLKANPDSARIPVIAITASEVADTRTHTEAMGCDGYLIKPVSRLQLLREMAKFLPKRVPAPKPEAAAPAPAEQPPVPEIHARWPELLERLKNECLPQWQEVREKMYMKHVRALAKQVNALGQEYQADALQAWAGELQREAKQQDLQKISETLAEFSRLLDSIEAAVLNSPAADT